MTVVDDIDPTITCPSDIIVPNDQGECGAIVNFAATADDNCSALITYNHNPGSYFEVGTTSVTATATDPSGNSLSCTFNVTVENASPIINSISAPPTPVAQGTLINLSATFTDNNLVKATWYLSPDGSFDIATTLTATGLISGNTITGSFSPLANVYTVKLVVEDACGELDTEIYEFVVVYNPEGGFVTGGGWITSLPGAMPDNHSATGKANFGFNAQYKKGKNNVLNLEGNTNFQFTEGSFHFKSSSYEAMTLVISGAKATYRGVGTVNGSGNYGFMVTAIDGQINGGGGIDKFRIKVWDKSNGNTVVYDNELGSSENAEASTKLGGGSIVIHEVKKKSLEVDVLASDLSDNLLKAYPNPFAERVFFDMQFVNDGHAVLEIFDMRGAKLTTLFDKSVEAGMIYRLEYAPTDVVPGILIYRLVKDGEVTNGRLIYQKQR